MTDQRTANGNFLATVDLGKDADIDFNIVTSVFGKGSNNIVNWINKGLATYINKEKTLNYLHFSERSISEASDNQELSSETQDYLHLAAPIAAASSSQELNSEAREFLSHQSAPIAATAANSELVSAANIVRNFKNPSVSEENSSSPTKTTAGRSTFAERWEMTAAVEDKPMKLYGNKVIKKMKKHGFTLDELKDLPAAVADPIAVFNNYQKDGNRSILTEMRTANGNFLVTVDLGKGEKDIDFNIVSSVFGKGNNNIVDCKQGACDLYKQRKSSKLLVLPRTQRGNPQEQ